LHRSAKSVLHKSAISFLQKAAKGNPLKNPKSRSKSLKKHRLHNAANLKSFLHKTTKGLHPLACSFV